MDYPNSRYPIAHVTDSYTWPVRGSHTLDQIEAKRSMVSPYFRPQLICLLSPRDLRDEWLTGGEMPTLTECRVNFEFQQRIGFRLVGETRMRQILPLNTVSAVSLGVPGATAGVAWANATPDGWPRADCNRPPDGQCFHQRPSLFRAACAYSFPRSAASL